MELLGCTRVIQTLREISRPSHLPWQLARLGRCVLAVDKSGESPRLTGHTPRRVMNNVSGREREKKKLGTLSQICVAYLWFYSHSMLRQLYLVFHLSFSGLILFIFTLRPFHSLCLFLPCFLFFSPAFSHAGRWHSLDAMLNQSSSRAEGCFSSHHHHHLLLYLKNSQVIPDNLMEKSKVSYCMCCQSWVH